MKGALLLPVSVAILVSTCFAQRNKDGRDADREAIKSEIGRITQAFIDGDIETIYKTHSEDWSGYLADGQSSPILGIDGYMKFYGFPWPVPAGYKPRPQPNLHYAITNYVCNFVVPDVGVASFNLDYPQPDGVHFTRLRIMDVFGKRNGQWLQTASYTATDPVWRAQQAANPQGALPDAVKAQLLNFRERVWRAWFAGDVDKLATMLPDDAVAISGSSPDFENRQTMLDGAKQFAAGGAKLTRIEFPRTTIQAYGNTYILFTTYSYDIEQGGKTVTNKGNAVETFIRKDGKLLNTGWILAGSKESSRRQ